MTANASGRIALLAVGLLVNPAPLASADATQPDAARIASIGGAVTEILYALGLADRIVAVDTTSVYPTRALAEKPNVGYMRQLSPEGVLSLNPTLILAIDGAGPKETIAVLAQAGIPLVSIPDSFTAQGIGVKIRAIARATGVAARGECLATRVGADLDALSRLRAGVREPLRVLFVLSFLNGRAMVAGGNTAADGIIRLAGARNAIAAYDGYKIINDEAIVAAAPDAVLVMQRSSEPLDAKTVFSHPAFQLTPAAANNRFISMEGLYLLGFGPRTANAARDLALALYPALMRAALPSERPHSHVEACGQ